MINAKPIMGLFDLYGHAWSLRAACFIHSVYVKMNFKWSIISVELGSAQDKGLKRMKTWFLCVLPISMLSRTPSTGTQKPLSLGHKCVFN